MSADRVLITAGTSEAIDLVLSSLVDSEGEVLVPMPTYPLYTALLAKIDARARYYRVDPARGWLPDLDHLESLVTTATRALVVIDPNNPTGATYPVATRRALLEFADRHGLVILADEVYGDLGYDGPIDPIGTLDPDAADHHVLEPVEGLPRAGLADRLDGGRPHAAARQRAGRHQKDVRRAAVRHRARCSTPSPKRCSAIGRTSRSSAPRCARAPPSRPAGCRPYRA